MSTTATISQRLEERRRAARMAAEATVRDEAYWHLRQRGFSPLEVSQAQWAEACEWARTTLAERAELGKVVGEMLTYANPGSARRAARRMGWTLEAISHALDARGLSPKWRYQVGIDCLIDEAAA